MSREKDHKKVIRAWTLYDWANSAFATTIMAAVLPIFYNTVAAAGVKHASSYWGYTQSIAMIIVALLAPVLGAIADYGNSKMRFLKFFALMGICGTSLLYFVGTGDYLMCSAFFIIASIGFSGGNIFYDSLLPRIADKNEMDRVSSLGYALGYLGGGILLAINLIMIQQPQLLGIDNAMTGTKLSFLSVSVWWLLFSIPIFRHIKDGTRRPSQRYGSYMTIGFRRIRDTFREISKYKELTKFLIAFWLYNDGIGTIIRMATVYGSDIGIGTTHLIGALLLTQFVGIPFSLLFGRLSNHIGAKKSLFVGIGVYTGITIFGYFMSAPIHFWILAFLVGTVQGGTQALSRSLFGSMVPQDKAAEFFGFMGISSKFAAIVGPAVFAFSGQLLGSSRYGIISLIVFFIAGGIILTTVDVEKGKVIAQGNNITI